VNLETYIQDLNARKVTVHAEFAARSSPLELDDDLVVKQYRDDFRVGLQVLQHQDDLVVSKPDPENPGQTVVELVPQPDKPFCLVIPKQDRVGDWVLWEQRELLPVVE
jgi:hypothetical protein